MLRRALVSSRYIVFIAVVAALIISIALNLHEVGERGGRTVFEKVTVVGRPLVLSPPAEVDAAEAQLGIRFPSGYREYVTQFGEGVLGGSYVRIYPPRRILFGANNLVEWRRRIDQYWFWDSGTLTKQQALEAVIIGDTLDGEELIVHPTNPERIYLLPRQSEEIYLAGDGLPAAIEWLCTSGTLTEPFPERNFEPFNSQARQHGNMMCTRERRFWVAAATKTMAGRRTSPFFVALFESSNAELPTTSSLRDNL